MKSDGDICEVRLKGKNKFESVTEKLSQRNTQNFPGVEEAADCKSRLTVRQLHHMKTSTNTANLA